MFIWIAVWRDEIKYWVITSDEVLKNKYYSKGQHRGNTDEGQSVSVEQMKTMRKTIKDIEHLEAALKKIRKMGILIHASMIFGFDNDTKEVFDETVDFLIKNKISTVSFNVLTPYPGTKTYDDLKNEGRLLTDDWKYYDHNTVVFQPKNMTPYELQWGKTNARKRFYSIGSVLKRFWTNRFSPMIYFATNYGHIKQTKVEAARLEKLKKEVFDSCRSFLGTKQLDNFLDGQTIKTTTVTTDNLY